MSQQHDAEMPTGPASASTSPPAATTQRAFTAVARNTVADTWGWLWKDALGRVTPFLLAAGTYAYFSGQGAGALGLWRDGWWRPVALGVALGLPMAGLAAGYRAWSAPGFRLPTLPDQVFQTAYYFVLNAPAEELFWRGTVQT
ncbi:MAG: hypothetical protein IVW57_12045, partial [Ktedonobacterales bacterium]|nr:hypothetical protein [Ktedonobacterales bacterium]